MRAALDAHLEATHEPFRHLRSRAPVPEDTYEARGAWAKEA